MSEHEPRPCGEDVAAYALGALNPEEAEAFRRHLETCAICRDELESFANVVDLLPTSPPAYAAPPRLRRRVKRAIAAEQTDDGGRRRVRGRLAGLPRPALAGGLAFTAAVIALVVVLVTSNVGGSSTRVISAQVTGAGRASLRVSGGHGELVVRNFPAPPSGKIYEVWLVRGRRPPAPTSALFGVTASGSGDVDVPGSLTGVTQVLVTPEPAGGTRVPTHAPVIAAQLT